MGNLIPSEICNEIVAMIKAEKGADAEIETKHNAAYSSIMFLGIHSLRVKCGRKNYIGLKNSYEHIWENDKSIKIERIKSDELWSRVSFNSQEELKNLYPLFLQLYDEAYLLVSIEIFSCCSRFTQCSDEKICIQPDKRLALGCQYRKNLTSGRIFYGENCNGGSLNESDVCERDVCWVWEIKTKQCDGGCRMGNNFFEEMAEQSEIKSKIVAEYFSIWAKIMSIKARSDRLAYIDLFAGPGRYEDGSKSTPIKVLEFILSQPTLRNKMVTMFNDANPSFAGSLQKALYEIPGIELLKHKPIIHNTQVGDELTDIFSKANLVPTFAFVDPWGYKGLSSRLIMALVKDWGSDSIFFFNYNRINMGITNKIVEDHINSIFGEERANLIRPKLKGLSPEQRELLILNELAQSLSDNGVKYVLPFRFVWQTRNRTSHYLIFVTKNVLGYSLMKDVMWRNSSLHEDGVASFSYIPVNNNPQLSFLSLFNKPLDQLGEDLLRQFSGKTLGAEEVYDLHHVNTPFVFPNYQEALRRLESDGKIIPDRPADKRPKRNGVVTFAKTVQVKFP